MTRTALKIVLPYLGAAVAWIVLTDQLVEALAPAHADFWQTAKGLLFVTLTSVVLYLATSHQLRKRDEAERNRRELERRLAASTRFDALGRLTGGIAHDFNNVLTVITGNLGALVDGWDEGRPVPREVTEAQEAARRATGLTRQLLAYGRRQVLQPEYLNAAVAVEETTALLGPLIGDRIRVVTRVEAEERWRVHVDRARLEQVIMNLALNARDAMPDGGTLTLVVRNVVLESADAARFGFPVRPGPYVQIEISDTGIGMDARTQERIFEPFFSTKAKEVGTGLGLSTVYGIVKQSDGYITVDSESGVGSTFQVYLPRDRSEGTATPAPPARMAGDPDGGGEASATGTIMVVEDERPVRALVSRILISRGFQVLEAADGEEALELVRSRDGRIDLIITDAIMPGMDGMALIRSVREVHPGCGFLLISGYTGDEVAPEGVPYLGKPFTPADLLDRVRELLDGPPGPEPPPSAHRP